MTEKKKTATGKKNVDAHKISKLFDIRLIVGGLLAIYGLILAIVGLVKPDLQPSQQSDTAAQTGSQHLNLWTGLAMLVFGLLMLAWMRWRPLQPPDADDLVDEGPQESRAE